MPTAVSEAASAAAAYSPDGPAPTTATRGRALVMRPPRRRSRARSCPLGQTRSTAGSGRRRGGLRAGSRAEGTAVVGRGDADDLAEVVAQQGARAEAAALRDVVDGKVGVLEQALREQHALQGEPAVRGGTGLG